MSRTASLYKCRLVPYTGTWIRRNLEDFVKQRFAALLALLLAVFLLVPAFAGETPAYFEGITTSWPFAGFPERDEEGYLVPGAVELDEFIHSDFENGVWVYLSPSLQAVVYRCEAKLETGAVRWYEGEVKSRKDVVRVFSDNPARPRVGYNYPQLIARAHKVVLALNGDYFTFRTGSKIPNGVIIRDGAIVNSRTSHGKQVMQPPLDELALYADGRFELRYPREITAQDYLDRGALDVVAFGPILIRDGVMDDRIEKKFRGLEPRSAIGMVKPGHYIFMNVEGRIKASAGATCLFLAERMQARGAVQAFTLDGGQTSGMFFMGTHINEPGEYNGSKFIRKQPDIVGIGYSEQVRQDNKRTQE